MQSRVALLLDLLGDEPLKLRLRRVLPTADIV
jgi:hypothetical protein